MIILDDDLGAMEEAPAASKKKTKTQKKRDASDVGMFSFTMTFLLP